VPADIVFKNGPIITIDPEQPAAEAVAICGKKIVRVGSAADLQDEIGPSTRVINLEGRALLPGLNDNHNHPISLGMSLTSIDASPSTVTTLPELQQAFRTAADEARPDEWLIARGYDDSRLDIHRHPTRYELDEATGGRPALLIRTCGHMLVANSAALELAGVNGGTPDPPGGQIDRDEGGEPIGLLRENAQRLVRDHVPSPTHAQLKEYLRAAGQQFIQYGITSVGEAAITTSDQLAAYQELARAGELPMRVFTMMLIDETLSPMTSLGLQTGFGDEWLRIGPAKLFQDGSGGGRTAAMMVDYRNDPGNRGITIYEQQDLNERFRRANEAGFQMAAHAIGDLAITMILDAFEHALSQRPRNDHRARIEHCGMCTPEHLQRMKRLGVLAIPQPSFIYYLGDTYLENFTGEQISLAYPCRSWIDHGILAAGSSDAPVVSANPFVNLRSAVTRLTQDGQAMGANQAISIDEAITLFTINGAYASFEESVKGSITEGKLADLTVLDRDPRSVPAEELHTLRAEMTVIDGKIVFEA
jgi:predicted amidohydrolase YtcJ